MPVVIPPSCWEKKEKTVDWLERISKEKEKDYFWLSDWLSDDFFWGCLCGILVNSLAGLFF